jgi:hypothetical protein
MAGSNLSQVFIAHSDLVAASGAIGKAQVGLYNLATNDYKNDAAWTTLDRIMFRQGTGGNPINSPLLDTRNIRRVDYTKFEATVAHKVVVAGTAPAAGRTVTFRFVIKTAPVDYLSYYPNGADITLDNSTYEFPLNGFHANNHKVIPVDILSTGTLAGDLARVKLAVEAHGVLNPIMAVSTGTVAGDTFTARHPGVTFDIAFQDSEDVALAYTATVTGFKPGVGNAWQVIGDERRCQFKNGNFNRTHIPVAPEQYANATFKYDKITVEYAHNWPNSTGIAPAGELNQLVIYVGDGATALEEDDLAAFQTVFAIALATDEDQLYSDL